jgi:small subunit ribosomal protein S15
MVNRDRRIQHLQRTAQVTLTGPLNVLLAIDPHRAGRALVRNAGSSAVLPAIRGSSPGGGAGRRTCGEGYGHTEQKSFVHGCTPGRLKLVAKALHPVELAASQKGSRDKHLGVCAMALTVEQKGGIVAQFRRDTSDTGSPEVQVALLSERINGLGEHFTAHKRDHSSRRGLVKLVNQRRKLLDYLKSTQPQKYQELVERLGLRR